MSNLITTSSRLACSLCGIELKNPTVCASGILGTTLPLIRRVADCGAGAVTIKSISAEPREGHHNPTVLTFEAGMINAVGYSNPGLDEALRMYADLSGVSAPVIASVIGAEPDDFARMAEALEGLDFAAVELPLSCPHTPGFGLLAGQGTPEATGAITRAARKATKKPLFIKISPSIPALNEVARAAEDNGADAITAGNSMGPGMIINIEARRPMLDFKVGGVTGPALRPIALRCVYDIYEAVSIPIIGTGGVSTGRHAIELMMAGAAAVGIGTAVYERGVDVFGKVASEMDEWMRKNKVNNVAELIGVAHE